VKKRRFVLALGLVALALGFQGERVVPGSALEARTQKIYSSAGYAAPYKEIANSEEDGFLLLSSSIPDAGGLEATVTAQPVKTTISYPTPNYTHTIIASPTVTPTPSPTSTITPEPSFTPTISSGLPSLEEFTEKIRDNGLSGIWSDGNFAYTVYNTSWGTVLNIQDSASFATFQKYSAYFIHDYMGGSELYHVPIGARVAAISGGGISWYEIDGIHKLLGTPSGVWCGYRTNEEFFLPDGSAITAYEMLDRFYTQPFVIQTCYCEDGRGGVLLLTGKDTTSK